jgi:hypothetical protein
VFPGPELDFGRSFVTKKIEWVAAKERKWNYLHTILASFTTVPKKCISWILDRLFARGTWSLELG